MAQGQAMDPELTERFMKSIERAIMDSDDPEALIARLGRINGVLARGEMVTPQMLEGMPDYLVREFEAGGALDASAEAAAVLMRLRSRETTAASRLSRRRTCGSTTLMASCSPCRVMALLKTSMISRASA